MSDHHDHHDHHDHQHQHGHDHDKGLSGAMRYLRLIRRMWRSPVSDAVVDMVAPRRGELVVDLGAGMGPASVRAVATGAQVLAVDPTPFMRAMLGLRRRLGRRGRSLSVHDGAAESLPVADGSVDALWCVNAVHHWTDRAAALDEIARVLRPGGRAVLVDEDFADPTHPSHAAHQARRARHAHHFDHVDPDEIAPVLVTHGFVVDEAARRPVAGRPAVVLRLHRP